MVASEEEEVKWVEELIHHQQAEALQGLFPTIYIVSQEEVATLSRLTHTVKDGQ